MKSIIIIISIAAALSLSIFNFTGFYVVPEYELATSCDTCEREGDETKPGVLWFWRPGLNTPFITSDGGMLISMKEQGIKFFDRVSKTAYLREKIRQRSFIHFPYTEFMYKLSADGREPMKYDDAF